MLIPQFIRLLIFHKFNNAQPVIEKSFGYDPEEL